MSERSDVGGAAMSEPIDILRHAAGQLQADGHTAHAEAITAVARYLHELEVNYAAMTRAVDELLAKTPPLNPE